MRYIIAILTATILFASHGNTNDPDLKLALNGNFYKAFKGFKKRCSNNEAYACGMVGYFLDKGFGVKKDHKKAIKFYQKGCNLNDADSCTLLGYFNYKNGNLKKAKKLLQKACKIGNKDACNYLGKI
jgi:TPR repeat protein